MHKLGEGWDVGEWEGITFTLIYVSSLSWGVPQTSQAHRLEAPTGAGPSAS